MMLGRRSRTARWGALSIAVVALLAMAASCAPPTNDPPPLDPEPVSGPMRPVLLVGNSAAGTVSFIDPDTFENLGSINAIPDLEQRLAEINANPITAIAYEVTKGQQRLELFEPSDGNRFIDDVFTSPDGKTLYVSRSNLSDVVAIDLTRPTHPIKWRHIVNGFHADHATISPDGTKIVVSVTTAKTAEVLDAATGKLVGSFPTGDSPHQNDYSADGKHIYNGSIGGLSLPYALNGNKGARELRKVDAATLQVVRTYSFDRGVRPTAITPDESIAYIQLSYLNGLVKFDLDSGQIVATSDQPLSAFAQANYHSFDDYPHNSAHHGLALSEDGTKLCDVGTIDNTVQIVSADDLSVTSSVDVGLMPYWATNSPDGQYCFVTVSGADRIAVIDYDTGQEVASIPTGWFPQRNRLGAVPESELEFLAPIPG